MRRHRLAALLGCVACLATAGCKVTPPGKAESAIVNWVKHHVTVHGKNNKNPFASNPETIAAGQRIFGFYCVVCHGRDGENTGVPFARNISPPIPSLSSTQVQSYTDGQLKWIIDNGISPSGMPAAKGILGDDDIWKIVVYLRHLPPAGSLGEPRAYSGDEYAK